MVVADVSEAGNQETARIDRGTRRTCARGPVRRVARGDVKAALARTVEVFGRLDFAFNNAGIEPGKPAPTADFSEQRWFGAKVESVATSASASGDGQSIAPSTRLTPTA